MSTNGDRINSDVGRLPMSVIDASIIGHTIVESPRRNGTAVIRRIIHGAVTAHFLMSLPFVCMSFSGLAMSGGLTPEQLSVESSIGFLANRMDEFHNRFPIYDDVSSAGNHFPVFGAVGANATSQINGSWSVGPHSGATCLKFVFTPANSSGWGGYYMMNGILPNGATSPIPNWGTYPNDGINIFGARSLTFWAKGTTGREILEFFFGGVGRDPSNGRPIAPYPDSAFKRSVQVRLTTGWQKYSIDLSNSNTSYLLGGFGWVASYANNPAGATFYVDYINIELTATGLAKRLSLPRFLRSFLTAPKQSDPFDANTDDDIDFVLRNTAFAYDNALAVLAFLAHGTPDSLRRARLLGDAFVYASQHDRTFTDGRIRTDYAAGDVSLPPGWIANGKKATVPIPGFYYEPTRRFYEVEQQAVDTGNNAWAMIALLKLYQKTAVTSYLDTARKIGKFIHGMRYNDGTYPGFLGGINNPETAPTLRTYASTEHNLDIAAAFSVMNSYKRSGDPDWLADATHAKAFVEKMFGSSLGCYYTGTSGKNVRNENYAQLPLDTQTWSILSLRSGIRGRYTTLLNCMMNNHKTTKDGFTGFDFNTDRDGVWFEGSGQAAVAYTMAGRPSEAIVLREMLRSAQAKTINGDTKGTQAVSHDGLTTGFDFKYFQRKHTGATAWNVFAQKGFNPYYDR